MAQQSAVVHRLSGRKVVDFPITSDPKLIMTVVMREKVRYVMVSDRVAYEYYSPTEEERWQRIESTYPSAFHGVRRGPGYRVFEVDQWKKKSNDD